MVLGVGSLSCLYRLIIVCCQRHFITVDSFEVFALSYSQFFKDILLALQSWIWSKLLDSRSLVWQLIDGQRDYFGRCGLVFIWRFQCNFGQGKLILRQKVVSWCYLNDRFVGLLCLRRLNRSESLCNERSLLLCNLFLVLRWKLNLYGLFFMERLQEISTVADIWRIYCLIDVLCLWRINFSDIYKILATKLERLH